MVVYLAQDKYGWVHAFQHSPQKEGSIWIDYKGNFCLPVPSDEIPEGLELGWRKSPVKVELKLSKL